MPLITEESAVIAKTRELCETLLHQPDFKRLRENIDSFLQNEDAKAQYQSVMEKGEALQQKQQLGMPLSQDEITEFEQNREKLFSNPVAKGFLDAQQEMHVVQESVGKYVAKTFELGRIPGEEDFDSGSCGSGCGCHH